MINDEFSIHFRPNRAGVGLERGGSGCHNHTLLQDGRGENEIQSALLPRFKFLAGASLCRECRVLDEDRV